MSLKPARNLIDELLAEQQSLTAVERFSQFHENWSDAPALAPHYRELIPLSAPGPGEQYSFEVDLDACSGCKACVTACHSLNGLDEGESWRDVGTLVGESNGGAPVQQTVTSACHHCADPACANGCPTLAYEKDADTGIVRHLDDQCIGCQYCTMTCPYDVPKYNGRLGIVRKCDMCHGRLAEGEAPACVQACPNEAIRIRVVPVAELDSRVSDRPRILPGTAPSEITKPSTSYLNLRRSGESDPLPADHDGPVPAHSHFPLAIMLVLTQAAAGTLLADVWFRFVTPTQPSLPVSHTLLGAALAVVGLVCATLHLGRPLHAWKSFLGWRKSWLSREILVFGPWAGLSMAYAGAVFFSQHLPNWIPPLLGAGATATGLLGVFCSVMVYVFTKRPFWSLPLTGFRFGFTGLILGTAFTLPLVAATALASKVAVEEWMRHTKNPSLRNSMLLLRGPLARERSLRLIVAGTAFALLLGSIFVPALAVAGFVVALAGEILARLLFFRAVDHTKMPGGAAPGCADH